MAELPPYPPSEEDSRAERQHESAGKRRMKTIGMIFLALLVLAPIIIHLILIGGPGRHLP
jgi:hypothetical protein